MTRIALAAAIAGLLLFCVAVGWALGRLSRRPAPAGGAEAEIADLTARLHAAEAARDAAERRCAMLEGRAPRP
jgi:hypothetical protein